MAGSVVMRLPSTAGSRAAGALPVTGLSIVVVIVLEAVACGGGDVGGPQSSGPTTISRNQILFVSGRVSPAQLFVIDDDGSGVRQVTRSGYDRGEPDVSPDGSKIAFTMWAPDVSCLPTYPTCGHEIYVMDADGSDERRLTTNTDQDGQPVWSPDGTRIAFVGARSGIANIHVVNADGSGGRQVTHLGGWNEQPTWSSDGSHIAFANFDGVYVAKADGSGGAQLLIPFGDWPAWSPDGSRIAYGAAGGGIAVSKADGTGAVRLTDDGLDWMPAWSSDGERIAFARGYNDVYVMNADGSALLDVTQHQFHDYYPAWGRAR